MCASQSSSGSATKTSISRRRSSRRARSAPSVCCIAALSSTAVSSGCRKEVICAVSRTAMSSGTGSMYVAWPKAMPKSMAMARPVAGSIMKLSRWRSPMPRRYCAMVSAARLEAKAERIERKPSAPVACARMPRPSRFFGASACAASSLRPASSRFAGVAVSAIIDWLNALTPLSANLLAYSMYLLFALPIWFSSSLTCRTSLPRSTAPCMKPLSVSVPSIHSSRPTLVLSGATA